MSNILKSTKLDIALVKPYFKTICFTLLLPIVFAAINRSLLTGVSFAMCFIAMTTGYTFSITEKNSMDRLFGILPVRKSELVIGRYVFVLAMGLLSLIISLIAQPLVLKVLGETVGVFDIVTAANDVPIWEKYTLTIEEASKYFRIGENKLRRLAEENPTAGWVILNGNRIQIKRKQRVDIGVTVQFIQHRSLYKPGKEDSIVILRQFFQFFHKGIGITGAACDDQFLIRLDIFEGLDQISNTLFRHQTPEEQYV